MPSFEETNAYAPKEPQVFFDDGREEELVQFVTSKTQIRGSPKDVLSAIDEFGRTRKYLMNVGEDKGKIVVDLITSNQPNLMVELGGYCGYSTILFADALRRAGGQKYFSLERHSRFAQNIKTLVEFAGLNDVVEVLVGPSNDGIKKLHASRGINHIDMMFLDHYKPAYTSDLKLCESLGLISKGTILAADNVISPGNPPYLKYVRSTVEEKRSVIKREKKQNDDPEAFSGRTAAQYGSIEALNNEMNGNPDFIYESQLINSYEPTGEPDGVEVTRCMGEEPQE